MGSRSAAINTTHATRTTTQNELQKNLAARYDGPGRLQLDLCSNFGGRHRDSRQNHRQRKTRTESHVEEGSKFSEIHAFSDAHGEYPGKIEDIRIWEGVHGEQNMLQIVER